MNVQIVNLAFFICISMNKHLAAHGRTAPAQHRTGGSLGMPKRTPRYGVWASGYAATAGVRGGRNKRRIRPAADPLPRERKCPQGPVVLEGEGLETPKCVSRKRQPDQSARSRRSEGSVGGAHRIPETDPERILPTTSLKTLPNM